jgi:hypothetical protein
MYGAKFQQANPLDTSPPLNKAGKKFIQDVTGVFLYLAQAVDLTMLTVCSAHLHPNKKHLQKRQCKNAYSS